jgi:hypothetical protein
MIGGFSNESSGTVGFLVGIIVLVFTGIVLSLMVDKRFRFSSGKASLERSIAEEGHELETVRRRLEVAKDRWNKEFRPLEGQEAELVKAKAAAGTSSARLQELRDARAAAAAGLDDLQTAFAGYRDRYCQQVRQAAAGEKLPELRVRGGKVYRDVTIRRVTAAGMEIAHSQGNSRIKPEDLEGTWHERFQWTPGELEELLNREKQAQARHAQAAAPSPEIKSPAKPLSTKEQAKQEAEKQLASLRSDVSDALRRLQKAEAEAARAQAEARNNRGKSVPGSLETWGERAARLELASGKFRSLYVAARGRLAAVSPTDSLLQVPAP